MTKEELTIKLGAKKFQKLVYKAEHIKYFLLKNQLSFLVPMVEKRMKKNRDRLINNTSDPVKQDMIDINYKNDLILFRKELNNEKNRNYHFDMDYSRNFKEYLLWNKDVHLKGIIKNSVLITASIITCLLTCGVVFNIAAFIAILNTLSFALNFECVNLQNYHLIRYEKVENRLNERKNKQLIKKGEKYPNAIKEINRQIEKSNELPKLDVRQMKIEELLELRNMLLEVQNNNNKQVTEVQNNKKLERRKNNG